VLIVKAFILSLGHCAAARFGHIAEQLDDLDDIESVVRSRGRGTKKLA